MVLEVHFFHTVVKQLMEKSLENPRLKSSGKIRCGFAEVSQGKILKQFQKEIL